MPASRKLQASDARALLKKADRLVVARGRKVSEHTLGSRVAGELVESMLGPTGNLRAPTAVAGSTVLVGFNEDVYRQVFG